ncbi:MAG TPA: cytochrome c [Polyangiaceae bacterium]|nr:cytochrome c [Polyangiaceae bacterium]
MKSRFWLIGVLAALSACGGSSPFPEPTAADQARGSAHFPDVTLSELSHGRTLYVSRCGSCHALKRPLELAPAQWQAEVTEMRSKNGVKLSDSEAQAIIRYLTVAATAG